MSQVKMRAKMKVQTITRSDNGEQETLHLTGVSKPGGYPDDGSDEDNTFAKFSPMVDLAITIANPALVGTFAEGEQFYVDFTQVAPAEAG